MQKRPCLDTRHNQITTRTRTSRCTLPPVSAHTSKGFLIKIVTDLCARNERLVVGTRSIPRVFDRVHIVLADFRLNLPQQALAEFFGISQSTVSRLIAILGYYITEIVAAYTHNIADIPKDDAVIADGTLCLTGGWKDAPDNYNGKYRKTGVMIQVVTNLYGELVWVSAPFPGKTHDAKAIVATGLLEHMQAPVLGDKGYLGLGMITPVRKPADGELDDQDRAYNRSVDQIRWRVEQTHAHLKAFKCLSTPYLRPLETIPEMLRLVVGLFFFKPYE